MYQKLHMAMIALTWELIVKLCVHFCVCVSATRKLFLVSNERYGKNKTFLLQWYGIDFAPIKILLKDCLRASLIQRKIMPEIKRKWLPLYGNSVNLTYQKPSKNLCCNSDIRCIQNHLVHLVLQHQITNVKRQKRHFL